MARALEVLPYIPHSVHSRVCMENVSPEMVPGRKKDTPPPPPSGNRRRSLKEGIKKPAREN